ncbi:MAG: transposase [Deltaproteobacteria bacterium]|nr:transposase [Deltaproteobacteria bacterium]
MGLRQFSQKQKLVILDSAAEIRIEQAAKVAGVHYTTIYDWHRQLKSMGKQVFLDYKPSYPGRGIKQIGAEKEKAVLDTWKDNPGFGPGQVRNQLRRQAVTISIGTVRCIMEANGYKVPKRKSAKEHCQRFEARRPLELVQMDVLEFFINKLKVYMLLLLDDFSRFILGWRLLTESSIDGIILLVQTAMDRYGKMEEILTDRGFVFYSWRGINRFERFLQNQGIDHIHARAHHPQTLGKVEACNRRIKQELIDEQHFATVAAARSGIGNWVYNYNYKRTHQGIGGFVVPAERFRGQADEVLAAVAKGIDLSTDNCYSLGGTERSMMNLVLGPDGQFTLYILGRPIPLPGGAHVSKTQPPTGGHSD